MPFLPLIGKEIDGMVLSRGIGINYSLDDAISMGKLIVVGRVTAGQELPKAPQGATSYSARVVVTRRLLGLCPDEMQCRYKVFHDFSNSDENRRITPPPPADKELLMIGTFRAQADGAIFSITRFVEPNPTNVELVSGLISQYHGKKESSEIAERVADSTRLAPLVMHGLAHRQDASSTPETILSTGFNAVWIWIGIGIAVFVLVVLVSKKKKKVPGIK